LLALLQQRFATYFRTIIGLSRNCHLSYLAAALSSTARGVFLVVFNLYMLNMGVSADTLGRVLSVEPFAQAIASIPAGFMAEKIGFRKSLVIIYGLSSLAKLAQVSTDNLMLISLAALVSGLAFSGDFVVRLPFLAANTTEDQRTYAFTLTNMIFGICMSLGALFAGQVPNLMLRITPDLTVAYRYTLLLSGAVGLLSVIPAWLVRDLPTTSTRKISLYPYLWGIDVFTKQQAIVSLLIGIGFGTLTSFANVYFVYHLGTTREFFAGVSAVAVIPTTIATSLGPSLAHVLGTVASVTWLRLLMPVTLVIMALTRSPIAAAIAYWGDRSMAMTSQPLSFTYAMGSASAKAKGAVAAWLNTAYWFGNGLAAPIAGFFIARSNYALPLLLGAAAVLFSGVLNHIYFRALNDARHGEVQR